MLRKGVVFSLASVLAIGGIFLPSGTAARHPLPHLLGGAADNRPQISEAYTKLPLYFEVNRGQTAPQVKFLSRGGHHVVFLTSSEAVLVLTPPKERSKDVSHRRSDSPEQRVEGSPTVLRTIFAGANPAPRVTGLEELPGKANYFIGSDPAKWRTDVPTYAKVRYHDLYPGIDLIYYGNRRQLEHDFVVNPGADPNRIMLGVQGAARVEVDAQGDLLLHTAVGPIRQRKPVIYQEIDGVRKEIPGGYVLMGEYQVGFKVAAYDVTRSLIIDPVLFYSTFLGGSGGDMGFGIAVDGPGNAYVTGVTSSSTDFPTTAGAKQTSFGGASDAFVTKLNPTGSAPLVYSTYLGGSGDDTGFSIAVDSAGNAYVTGGTTSTNFPTTPGAFQTTLRDTFDAFVTKLNPTGSGLFYSTYLGGNNFTFAGSGIAVDAAGSAYVITTTRATDFPTTPGAFQSTLRPGSCQAATVTKFNAAGSGLVYSTYLGGTSPLCHTGPDGIAVDSGGNAYVVGHTDAADFPTTPGAFQTTFGGGGPQGVDAFVTKLNPLGAGLVYSTFLGGSNDDFAFGIALDGLGNAYVTGHTASTNFPTTPGAFQTSYGGGANDAFVTKLNPTGSGLVYSTYLGGSGDDEGRGIAVDAMGNAHVTGFTNSTNFPTANPIQLALAGGFDAFVTVVNPTGTGLIHSTYLGGSSDDFGAKIALDSLPNPNVYVVGFTSSTNFPTTTGAFQTTYGGGSTDAFVVKIANIVLPPGESSGKVTGGGTVNVPGGIANFGFIVQAQLATGQISGDLQYHNHASGAKIHSEMFDTFTISGNTATFSGTCTNNDVPCTFSVMVQDNGRTGENDVFTISIDFGPTEGGTLRSGKIQIHQCPCN